MFGPNKLAIGESRFTLDVDWREFYGNCEEEDPKHMPESLGKPVMISAFVVADHAGNMVTRKV